MVGVVEISCNRPSGAGFPHTPQQVVEHGTLPARYSFPERDLRLEILQRKLSLPFNKLLRDLLLQYPLEEPVDPALADYLWQFRRPLCEWIRERELFSWHPEPLLWVSLKPYRSGSEIGDYMIVLRQSQRTLLQQSGDLHERE